MKYRVIATNVFNRELKYMIKRGMPVEELDKVVEKLSNGKILERKYHDHKLYGQYEGYRECHIRPDWLLVYRKQNDILLLTLARTGTHSDLFN